jgi:hypothetical protein
MLSIDKITSSLYIYIYIYIYNIFFSLELEVKIDIIDSKLIINTLVDILST